MKGLIRKLKVEHFPVGVPGGVGHTWLATDIGDPGRHQPVGVGYSEEEAIADLIDFLSYEISGHIPSEAIQ